MKFGLDRKGFEETLKSLNDLVKGVTPEEIAQLTRTIETTAKKICEDSENKIVFKYLERKKMEFSVKDNESRDCLVKAIEMHIDSMPMLLQGFFSVLKYRLINLDLNQ